MPTAGNVVQLHKYEGMILDKENGHMMLMWCKASDKVMEASSKTHPVSLFVHQDINELYPKLIEAGWKVTERFSEVDVL